MEVRLETGFAGFARAVAPCAALADTPGGTGVNEGVRANASHPDRRPPAAASTMPAVSALAAVPTRTGKPSPSGSGAPWPARLSVTPASAWAPSGRRHVDIHETQLTLLDDEADAGAATATPSAGLAATTRTAAAAAKLAVGAAEDGPAASATAPCRLALFAVGSQLAIGRRIAGRDRHHAGGPAARTVHARLPWVSVPAGGVRVSTRCAAVGPGVPGCADQSTAQPSPNAK